MVLAIHFSDQSRKGPSSFLARKDLKMHSWHLLQSSPVPENFAGGLQKLRKHQGDLNQCLVLLYYAHSSCEILMQVTVSNTGMLPVNFKRSCRHFVKKLDSLFEFLASTAFPPFPSSRGYPLTAVRLFQHTKFIFLSTHYPFYHLMS